MKSVFVKLSDKPIIIYPFPSTAQLLSFFDFSELHVCNSYHHGMSETSFIFGYSNKEKKFVLQAIHCCTGGELLMQFVFFDLNFGEP